MEKESEILLNKIGLKKISRSYKNNIFSEKLNKNLINIIMSFLNIENICNFNRTCIFIYNNFIDFENFKIHEDLINEGKNSLLRINTKDKKPGFAILCEIPCQYSIIDLTKAIIVNNNIIKDLEGENKLEIFNNKIKEIDLNNKFKYIDQDYNITIIELGEENDEFNKFFNLKRNIFEYENDNKKLIYILYYSKDKKINVDFGELEEVEDKNIFNFLNPKNNFPTSSPIFDFKTKNLIGYFKGYNREKNINEGQYFRYPLNNFIYQRYSSKGIIKGHHLMRIFKEIKKFNENPNKNFTLISYDEDSYENEIYRNWKFIITVTDECPYKGGKFLFIFHFNTNYPFNPPRIELVNKIYHPNFKGESGIILLTDFGRLYPKILDILKNNWRPDIYINQILDKIYSLIINPSLEFEDIVNFECFDQMKNDKKEYEKVAKEWTEKYDSKDIYEYY